MKHQVERTIRLISQADLQLPPDPTPEQVWIFLRSGGKVTATPTLPHTLTLGQVAGQYFAAMPPGAKEESSIATERTHSNHLKKTLGPGTPMDRVGVGELQSYVNRRAKTVSATTIRKELQTLSQIWEFACARGWVSGVFPKRHLKLPRTGQRPPFQTRDEILRAGDGALWECLILRESEILDLLGDVKEAAEHKFILPMMAFAALTGARRSEIVRSQRSDWDLAKKQVLVREKKRVQGGSFRQIPILDPLYPIMRMWFEEDHPGGPHAICIPEDMAHSRTNSDRPRPLTKDSATYHFKQTLARHEKWSKVPGFHTFRHSFASNLAMRGVSQSIIDSWMGHQTEEMRRRYRHFFPEKIQTAVSMAYNGIDLYERAAS